MKWTRFYIRLICDITPYVRMRGIYCKGHEGCIIQHITIVGIHDNNCTIIITAAQAINRGLSARLLVWRAYNLSTLKTTAVSSSSRILSSKSFAWSRDFGSIWNRTFVLVIITLKHNSGQMFCNVVKYKLARCCIALQTPQIRPCDGVILISEVPAPLSIVSNHLLPRRFHPLIVWNTVSFYVCAMG